MMNSESNELGVEVPRTARVLPDKSDLFGSSSASTSIQAGRIVKSTERVKDLGEVFTPEKTVQAMLDLLPEQMWAVSPSPTFLEPACGDGNFLVAVLNRKLEKISDAFRNGKLPAGSAPEALHFHALQAVASVYGVDISVDNVVGGKPGHEVGARTRLINCLTEWHKELTDKALPNRSKLLRSAQWVVDHNILIGNMLPYDAHGRATGREKLPFLEYLFEPKTLRLTMRKTTLGEIEMGAYQAAEDELPLFSAQEPEEIWSGKALDLDSVDRIKSPKLRGPARNGISRRAT